MHLKHGKTCLNIFAKYVKYFMTYVCAGFLNSLTSTAKIADCPGVCVHALATLMCDDVLEDVQCPTTSMRCCLQDPINGTSSSENVIDDDGPISAESMTTIKNMIPTTTPTTTTTMLGTSTSSTSVKPMLVCSTDLVLENNTKIWVEFENCRKKLLKVRSLILRVNYFKNYTHK